MCEETDVTLIVFWDLNLAGVYLDLWFVKLCKHIHIFEKRYIFYRFNRSGHNL